MSRRQDCENCPIHHKENLIRLGLAMDKVDYVVALAGNPNTGKSTVFNALTRLRQHTGNWPGKTVTRAEGGFVYEDKRYKLVDLPGAFEAAVDYAEADASFRIKLGVLVRRLQEAAVNHSERVGFGSRAMVAAKNAWILNRLGMDITRWPTYLEPLTVTTWHRGARGFMAYRDFCLTVGEEIVAVDPDAGDTVTGAARGEGAALATGEALEGRDGPLVVDHVQYHGRVVHRGEGQGVVKVGLGGAAVADPRRGDMVLALDRRAHGPAHSLRVLGGQVAGDGPADDDGVHLENPAAVKHHHQAGKKGGPQTDGRQGQSVLFDLGQGLGPGGETHRGDEDGQPEIPQVLGG